MSDEDVADDPNGAVPLESEVPQVLGSQSVDWTPVIAFIASLEVTRKVILRSVPAFEVLRGFGAVFRKRTDPQKLYELSRQCQSIEEFWSHSRSETFIKSICIFTPILAGGVSDLTTISQVGWNQYLW